MTLDALYNSQFARFVEFASSQANPADSGAIARLGGVGPLGGRTVSAARHTGSGFFWHIVRGRETREANDAARAAFRSAVESLFPDGLPPEVETAMKTVDYDAGKPLTARRIMAVKTAIDASGAYVPAAILQRRAGDWDAAFAGAADRLAAAVGDAAADGTVPRIDPDTARKPMVKKLAAFVRANGREPDGAEFSAMASRLARETILDAWTRHLVPPSLRGFHQPGLDRLAARADHGRREILLASDDPAEIATAFAGLRGDIVSLYRAAGEGMDAFREAGDIASEIEETLRNEFGDFLPARNGADNLFYFAKQVRNEVEIALAPAAGRQPATVAEVRELRRSRVASFVEAMRGNLAVVRDTPGLDEATRAGLLRRLLLDGNSTSAGFMARAVELARLVDVTAIKTAAGDPETGVSEFKNIFMAAGAALVSRLTDAERDTAINVRHALVNTALSLVFAQLTEDEIAGLRASAETLEQVSVALNEERMVLGEEAERIHGGEMDEHGEEAEAGDFEVPESVRQATMAYQAADLALEVADACRNLLAENA